MQDCNFACCTVRVWNLVSHNERRTGAEGVREWVVEGEEVTHDTITWYTEEINSLYCSQNIIRAIQSKRMRWTEHVARTGENINAWRFSVRRLKLRRPHGRLTLGRKDNNKVDFKIRSRRTWNGLIWFRAWLLRRWFWNFKLDKIKGDFLNSARNCCLVRKDSAPCG